MKCVLPAPALTPVLTAALTGALAGALAAMLSGCITFRTVNDGITRARIGETIRVGTATVMPLKVLEDSRCPEKTQCVWAGRLRLSANVNGQPRELTLGRPDSPVTLVEAYPPRRADTALYPDEYRFGFTPGG